MKPPVAPVESKELTIHGHRRVDPYYWMDDRTDQRVLDYIEQENAYARFVLAETEAAQAQIFEEIKQRIPQRDQSVPVRIGKWWYSTRFEEGKNYPIFCRRASPEGDDEVICDDNKIAEGLNYCDVAAHTISPDGQRLALAIDTVGRRQYSISFMDIRTGESSPETIDATGDTIVWARDNKTVFYTRKDPVTLRPFAVFRHELGTDPQDDVCIFEEPDATYYVGLSKTKSGDFVVISCAHTLRSESLFIPTADPTAEPVVFLPRSGEHEYDIDHVGDSWWICSNDDARDFRLFRAPVGEHDRDSWQEIVAHRPSQTLVDFELFTAHIVVRHRVDGMSTFEVMNLDGKLQQQLAFEEVVYDASFESNREPDEPLVRVHYSSLKTPDTNLSFDLATGERTTLKVLEVGLGYDPDAYLTERLWATSYDGAQIPVSLVRRRDANCSQVVLYGYGAYGISVDPGFSAARVSLLERGVGFAIAHVRGGSERGREWYEQGRTVHKENSFHDFVACGERIIETGIVTSSGLFAWGGSAGGLLVGAALNMRPDLFRGVIAQVPFVDIVTTMLDDSIPLTTGEYDEWGDPREEEAYRRMLSYSPYDNVVRGKGPSVFVLSGLHDSQVQYFEPTKWVAKMRALNDGAPDVLLHTNTEAGHSGPSGRFGRYRETAMVYQFVISECGGAA